MRFLADMGVGRRVALRLRADGHDAVHLRDLGLQRLPDPDIFAKAAAEQRTILTFDLDFADIAAAAGSRKPSVVVFRLRNARADYVYRRLTSALSVAEPALVSGAIVVVQDTRIRVRSLPVGKH
jgi:predicted nuclease of predicted toxin-antitoxin system